MRRALWMLAGAAVLACPIHAAAQSEPSRKPARPSRVNPALAPLLEGRSNPPAALKESPAKPLATPAQEPVQAEVSPEAATTLRPALQPPSPPRVSLVAGQLTVEGANSTLGDILESIRTTTGIPIETLGPPSQERVAARIGPAPVRDVLVSLLQGSGTDYFILGSVDDPQKVERVVVTPRSASDLVAVRVTPSSRPGAIVAQPVRPSVVLAPPTFRDDDDPEGFVTPVNSPTAQPGDPLPQNAQPQQPKTPEELLEELRRLQQERKDNQINRNPRGERPQ